VWEPESASHAVSFNRRLLGKQNVPRFFSALGEELVFQAFDPHAFAATPDGKVWPPRSRRGR